MISFIHHTNIPVFFSASHAAYAAEMSQSTS